MELANPQTFNRYSYVGNDPINQVDPLGLASKTCGGNGTPCTQADDYETVNAATLDQKTFNAAWIRYRFEQASQGYINDTWDYTTSMYAASVPVQPGTTVDGTTAGEPIPPPDYRGRIQAQGKNPPVEKSVKWEGYEEAGEGPPDRHDGLAMLNRLWRSLTTSEKKDRLEALQKAAKWIMNAPPEGYPAEGKSKSFQNRNPRDPQARIDIEIRAGHAFGDRDKMPRVTKREPDGLGADGYDDVP